MKIFVTGGTGNIGQHVTLALYCVDKMDKVFGLRFDGGDDLAEHIAWNLSRAKAALAGETLHDPVHNWSGLEEE